MVYRTPYPLAKGALIIQPMEYSLNPSSYGIMNPLLSIYHDGVQNARFLRGFKIPYDTGTVKVLNIISNEDFLSKSADLRFNTIDV